MLLGIDTIDYEAPPAKPNRDAGDDGSDGDASQPPPETVIGKGCDGLGPCGDAGISCCESRLIHGTELGDFPMGCDFVPGTMPCVDPWGPEHPASVGDFYLDTFEVTVGRFRQFV